jgi:hypothetical protein
MLHEFLTSNHQLLISRCNESVAKRFGPTETRATIDHGVPLFLQQLVEIRCLDNAIADAVVAFGSINQTSIDRQAETLQQRLVAFSAEHRRLIDIAVNSLDAVKTGNIGIAGATGTLLAHALEELRSLTDRTLPEIRLASPGAKAVSA